jgi:predicted NUDIX family NTP pyrophosphohydrolase
MIHGHRVVNPLASWKFLSGAAENVLPKDDQMFANGAPAKPGRAQTVVSGAILAPGPAVMPSESAGILLYRGNPPEVFLIHMGGPFWAGKDRAAWSLPKGLIGAGEESLAAARREILEETGFDPQPPFIPLGRFRQNAGKNLSVWAAAGDFDAAALVSSTFSLEWPPHSGLLREFPEADRGAWLGREQAMRKIVKGQRPVLDAFFATLAAR